MVKVRLVMLAWGYRKEILVAVAILILLPFLLIGMVVSALIAGLPLVPDDLIPHYQYEAANLTAPDGSTAGSDGTPFEIDWNTLVAVDAVRRRQDFAGVTPEDIKTLAQIWLKKVDHPGGQSCEVGDPHCVCLPDAAPPSIPGTPEVPPPGGIIPVKCIIEPHTTYELRTLIEVLDELQFTDEQRIQLAAMGPVDTAILCDTFTPNPAVDYVWPVPIGTPSSCFGPRLDPFTGQPSYHWGVDIAAPEGTIVRAATRGTVQMATSMGDWGNLLIIQADDGTWIWYAHLMGFTVNVGQIVEKGQVVAAIGNTGKSTGPHLHFEIRTDSATPVNPLTYYR